MAFVALKTPPSKLSPGTRKWLVWAQTCRWAATLSGLVT